VAASSAATSPPQPSAPATASPSSPAPLRAPLDGVEALAGDRYDDLTALRGRTWDAGLDPDRERALVEGWVNA